jgi:ubiquinone biosynthesis monooxygenase Coq7
MRVLTPLDKVIVELDKAIQTVIGTPPMTERDAPDNNIAENDLSDSERKLSARLMRINHAGEVSAQALYQGQALTANLPDVKQAMEQAALEENDHLIWCQNRVEQLGEHTSVLNPAWYIGSFAIGAIAGKIGDKWSLGFVAETEKQVVAHLDEHLDRISEKDQKSRAILKQMKIDELHHGTLALEAGGAELPSPIKSVMGLVSKVMTKTTFWI